MKGETKLIFAKGDGEDVFLRIKKMVNETVRELKPARQLEITMKAILFPLLYMVAYVMALLFGRQLWILNICYCLMGIMLVIVFLNLVHEAVHNTLFQRKWLNEAYIYFFDVMGANSYIW